MRASFPEGGLQIIPCTVTLGPVPLVHRVFSNRDFASGSLGRQPKAAAAVVSNVLSVSWGTLANTQKNHLMPGVVFSFFGFFFVVVVFYILYDSWEKNCEPR